MRFLRPLGFSRFWNFLSFLGIFYESLQGFWRNFLPNAVIWLVLGS